MFTLPTIHQRTTHNSRWIYKRIHHEEPLVLSYEHSLEASRQRVRSTAKHYLIFALAAKLAICDDDITSQELNFVHHHSLIGSPSPHEFPSLFFEAAKDTLRPEHYARRLVQLFPANHMFYREVLQQLFYLATIDGVLNRHEIHFLKKMSEIFMVHRQFFLQLLGEALLPTTSSPFETLGITKHNSAEEIRQAYHHAVRACHPDTLGTLLHDADIVRLANARIATLSHAYSLIRQEKRKYIL